MQTGVIDPSPLERLRRSAAKSHENATLDDFRLTHLRITHERISLAVARVGRTELVSDLVALGLGNIVRKGAEDGALRTYNWIAPDVFLLFLVLVLFVVILVLDLAHIPLRDDPAMFAVRMMLEACVVSEGPASVWAYIRLFASAAREISMLLLGVGREQRKNVRENKRTAR